MAADTQNIWDKTEKHSLKFGDDIKNIPLSPEKNNFL